MLIIFSTDYSIQYTGFRLRVKAVDNSKLYESVFIIFKIRGFSYNLLITRDISKTNSGKANNNR